MRAILYNLLSTFYKPYHLSTKDRLRVLAYHGVEDSDKFEAQLQYLTRNFNFVDLKSLYEHLHSNRKLPEKPLLITFDDGDISVYENGLPLLKKYSIPSILFVITDLINTRKPFWWEEIRYHLGKEEGHKKSWEAKTWKNQQRLEYLEDLRSEKNLPPLTRNQLTTQQLKELQSAGMEIANHSHTHPMFDMCTDSEIRVELKISSEILNSMDFSENVFAYPNGNFDLKAERLLQESGINLAFLFDHKINSGEIDPLRISRIRVDSDTELKEFKVKVSGLHSVIYNKIANR